MPCGEIREFIGVLEIDVFAPLEAIPILIGLIPFEL
jgi:hypothetical protein